MMPKLDIVSIKVMVKPSSPTPNHLRDFKISLVDEMAPPIYIPIILFYSATDINSSFGTHDVETISNKLKLSLSKVLTLYYPFCGRFKCTSSSSVDCNDEGVPYIECKFPTNLIDILRRPQSQMQELLPFDPYNNVSSSLDHNDDKHKVTMGVQLSEFKCGGIALGVCLSHKVADGEATSSFLNAWAKTAKGLFNQVDPPQMDAALIFPPRGIEWAMTSLMVGGGNEKLVTKCFLFSPTDLSRLRARFGSFNPTRVEAVTALIWKSAIQVAKGSYKASMVCHIVNIRNRMVPPLPKNLFGNLWLYSISELVDLGDGGYGTEELCDLVVMVRNAIREASAGYSDMLLQGDGLDEFDEFFKEARLRVAENIVACCGFSSWTRFGFYEVDFGWGKPTKVRNINLPMKNVTYLIPTRTGDGIEAWVTMTELDMDEFQRNSELLQFALLE